MKNQRSALKCIISAATLNETIVANSSITLNSMVVVNTTDVIHYIRLYNKSTAPISASDKPVAVYPIPASTTANGFSINVDNTDFSSGLGINITTDGGLNGTAVATVNAIYVNISYTSTY